jgi:hypothetical protein
MVAPAASARLRAVQAVSVLAPAPEREALRPAAVAAAVMAVAAAASDRAEARSRLQRTVELARHCLVAMDPVVITIVE